MDSSVILMTKNPWKSQTQFALGHPFVLFVSFVVRLVLKSPCSKGRFFGLDFMPLRGRYFERSGLRTPISALFFGCGCLSTPSSRLELVRPQTRPFPHGLLRNSLKLYFIFSP
jgi:hypothetical protein